MLIIRPLKISWPIGFSVGAMIFIFLNSLYFLDMTPTGDLRKVHGVFEVSSVGRRDFPALVGDFGVARCELVACASSEWKGVKGMPAVALIDENHRIFELIINGEMKVESEKLKKGRLKIGCMIIGMLCFLVANVVWLILIMRNKR